ncbi:MAG: hypothetical protein RLZZ522_1989, partial [Verrucomicrobiota bacterium]
MHFCGVNRWINGLGKLLLLLALMGGASATPAEAPTTPKGPAKVVVIPIREQIAKPMLYLLRRGLKEAIHQGADTVVLDIKTPGGELGVTFEMLEAIGKFPGKTVAYVNN